MPKHGVSVKDENRAIRQEALRELLSNKGLVQKVLDSAEKLDSLKDELDATAISRLKAGSEIRLKLINKYLPDLKTTELTGEEGEAIRLAASFNILPVSSDPNPDT